jgi:alpha-glucosidase (family GH31 glycosyl hydrolase)
VIRGPGYHTVRWDFDAVPAFVRYGAIVPIVTPVSHMGQVDGRTIHLQCFGAKAHGRLWLSDGQSLGYQRGEYNEWELRFERGRFTAEPRHLGSGIRARVVAETGGRERVVLRKLTLGG